MNAGYLGWLDYTILTLTLGLSTVVGSYFGFFKQTEGSKAQFYLNGGQKLKVVPVAISICASSISSIGYLGSVTEMYEYGPHYFIGSATNILAAIIGLYLYLPVLHNLRVSSSYEYFEMRFSKPVRMLTAFLFILDAVLYSGIVMFIASLALAKMTGISLHLINLISCFICLFYTMVGGIQGVIWTDTLQAWMMVGSMVTIIVIGIINVGGVGKLIYIVNKGNRLQVDLTLTPFVRINLLSVVIGQTWYNAAVTFFNQSNVQRFNCLGSLKDLKWAILLVGIGCWCMMSLSNICGLVLYGIYADCDPITAKIIEKPEELLPMFVLDYAGNIPGFPGIFIAGLLSAALSSMSAKLNSSAGVIYHDFFRQIYHKPISDLKATLLMKCGVCVIGFLCLLMGFVTEHLGQIIQLNTTLQSISYGALIGLFTLGMLVPKANTKGAIVGGISGALVVGWICIGTQKALATGALVFKKLPVSIEGCQNLTISSFNNTLLLDPIEEPLVIYKISFMYYALIGTIITVVVGAIVSHFVDSNSADTVPLEYLSPPLRKYLESKRLTRTDPAVELKLLDSQTAAN